MSAVEDRPLIVVPEALEPEVLIEEARRRQHRRRRATSWAVALAAVAAIIFGITSGGGPPAKTRPISGGGTPASAYAFSWHDVTAPGGYIQAGAQITSVIRWHGNLYATGNLFAPGRLAGFSCRVGCDPVVWRLALDGQWRPMFAAGADGGTASDQLVATTHYLLLFSGAMSTELWRSTDGRDWTAVKIPEGMSWLWRGEIASNGTSVLATFFNRYIGSHPGPSMRFPNLNPLFSSTDGVHWTQGTPPDGMGFDDVAVVPRGFVAVGAPESGKRQALVRSTTGRSWSVLSPLPAAHGGYDLLAASRNGIVLERIPESTRRDASVQFLRSTNGRDWTTGRVVGGALTNRQLKGPMPQTLLTVPGGFVAFSNTNHYIWWSTDGRLWRRFAVAGGPPALFQPWAASVDGDSLLVVEVPAHAADGVPGDATTIWQLKLL
jgi:hypothetical protein